MATLSAIYANTYSSNVCLMAQQQGSLLYSHVTPFQMEGEKKSIELAEPTHAIQFTGNSSDTPIVNTVFGRRWMMAYQFHWGELINWTEDQGMGPIVDPTGPITMNGALAMGRCIDDIIIRRGLNGITYNGKEGTDQQALPASQKIAANFGSSDGNTGLTLAKLIKARSILGKSHIPIHAPGQEMVLVCAQSQMDDMLANEKVQSSDYNSIKALVSGEVDTFMGFKFVVIDDALLPTAQGSQSDSDSSTTGSDIRACFAFLKSELLLAQPQPISTKINERPDKCNAWQVYSKLKAGATRRQDKGVVKIMCKEA